MSKYLQDKMLIECELLGMSQKDQAAIENPFFLQSKNTQLGSSGNLSRLFHMVIVHLLNLIICVLPVYHHMRMTYMSDALRNHKSKRQALKL